VRNRHQIEQPQQHPAPAVNHLPPRSQRCLAPTPPMLLSAVYQLSSANVHHCIMTFTGWTSLKGFSSELLQLYTNVCTAWLHPTWLNCVCLPVAASTSRRGGLRSATASNLVVPRCRLTTYCSRAFGVAGPVCWNALPDYLVLKSSDISFDCFRQQLKHFYFVNIDTVLALL